MGAWGSGNFENDAVLDWLAELGDWSSLSAAFDEVLGAAPDSYIDADVCAIALGAAEIVAACLGRPGDIPGNLGDWVQAHRGNCDEKSRASAEACARRIENSSELQELFDEGGRNIEWHAHVEGLLQRLARP